MTFTIKKNIIVLLLIIILIILVCYLYKNTEMYTNNNNNSDKLFKFLEVHDYPLQNKLRLGEKGDGGYIIGDIGNIYDCYISAGISNEESFSRDFINKYNINKNDSYGFDGTINDYPYHFTENIQL